MSDTDRTPMTDEQIHAYNEARWLQSLDPARFKEFCGMFAESFMRFERCGVFSVFYYFGVRRALAIYWHKTPTAKDHEDVAQVIREYPAKLRESDFESDYYPVTYYDVM